MLSFDVRLIIIDIYEGATAGMELAGYTLRAMAKVSILIVAPLIKRQT